MQAEFQVVGFQNEIYMCIIHNITHTLRFVIKRLKRVGSVLSR